MTTLDRANPEIGSISAFFPCYNDAMSIENMVDDVRSSLVRVVNDFEIIVVNDGSRDDSREVLRRLRERVPELRVIEHETNRGYGGALISGFANSTKQWIFYTDGDAQYDATEILRCTAVATADTDVVQGFKIGRGDPFHRRVIGRAYHHLVKALFGLPVRDTDCDFRLIRRSAMDRVTLQSTSGVICVEMMYSLKKAGARFAEVGVSHHHRPHGKSQFFRLPAIARSAAQLVTLWFRLVPTRRGRRPAE